jgi:hypothetical protein
MGQDIVVYRSNSSMDADPAIIRAKKDSLTGKYCYYFDSPNPANRISPERPVAAKLRIGNIWAMAELNEDLRQAAGPTGLPLLEWCVRNATKNGGLIRNDLLDNLDREIKYLFDSRRLLISINLRVFLSKMREAIQIARREKNPIVFV